MWLKKWNKKTSKVSKVPPILRLPRELRDEIYRELLLAAKVRDEVTEKVYLKPAIIRVNKQIHEESSRVLYKENAWVLIRMNWCGLVGSLLMQGYPIVSHSPYGHLDGFVRKPALQVNVQIPGSRNPYAGASILLDAYSAHTFFRCFTNFYIPESVNFSVRFNPGMRKMPAVRDEIIPRLRDIRGSGKACVTGIDESTGNELVTLMMTPVDSLDEDLEPAATDQIQEALQPALEKSTHAGCIYLQGISYVNWEKERQIWGLPAYSSRHYVGNTRRHSTAYINSAIRLIRNGDLELALDMLNTVIGHGLYLTDSQKARARYYSGLALLQQGRDDWALEEFGEALIAQPGHEGAEKEIKRTELRSQTTDLGEWHPNVRKCLLPPGERCCWVRTREQAAMPFAIFYPLHVSRLLDPRH